MAEGEGFPKTSTIVDEALATPAPARRRAAAQKAAAQQDAAPAAPVPAEGIVVRGYTLGESETPFDGERLVLGKSSVESEFEHLHRYIFASELVAGLRVVDIASGEGYGSDILAQRARSVIGVDIDEAVVNAARRRYQRRNLSFEVGACEAIPLQPRSVDAVVSFETIEHIEDHGAFLDEVRRVMRRDGLFIISTPDHAVYNSELAEANEYHVHELSREQFVALLRTQFKNVTLLGQRVSFGSFLIGDDATRFEVLSMEREGKVLRAKPLGQSAVYWIAVASDGPLPALPSGLYQGDLPPNPISSILGGVRERDEEIVSLRQKLASAAVEAAALEAARQRIDELNASFDAARADAEQRAREAAQARADHAEALALAAATQTARDQAIAERDAAQTACDQAIAQRDAAQAARAAAEEEMRAAVTARASAERESAAAAVREEASQREAQAARVLAEALSAQCETAKAESAAALQRESEAAAQAHAAREARRAAESALAAAREALNSLQIEKDAADETIAGMRESLRLSRARLAERTAEIEDARARLQEALEASERLQRTIESRLKAAAAQHQAEADAAVAAARREAQEAADAARREAEAEAAAVQREAEAYAHAARREASVAQERAEAHINALQAANSELEQARAALVHERDAARAAATRTEAALAAAQGEAAAARAHGEALEREAQALRDALHQREAEHARALAGTESEARARCAALEGQLAEALQGSASLARLNQSLEASLRRMAQALQERAEPGEAREAPPAEAAPVVTARGSVLRDAAAFARYALRRGPLAAARLIAQARVVRASGLFDTAYYLSRYRDVAAAGADPALHYVAHGAAEGRDPSAAFSTRAYLQRYPDVQAGGRNPLFHYVRHGRSEGRSAAPLRSPRASFAPAPFAAGARQSTDIGTLPTQPAPFDAAQGAPHAACAGAEAEPIPAIAPRETDWAAIAAWPAAPTAPRWRVIADEPDPADRYAVRPDDCVAPEAAIGEAFFRRFGLLGPRPDFQGATAAINAAPRVLRLAGADEIPDASIIIPVYGQLAYTLNCLDSVFAHESVFSAEIIIVDDCSPDETGAHLPRVDGVRYHRQAQNGGFILSCNAGGAMARGRYVVFLNNDTRLVKGWLDELIGGFEILPNAGLVGSKLFYADSSLQEAGGIIWQDGTAWNFGRNDDPGKPEYCYARQVDYVSGASIALPMAVWRELGGFDELYRPAYGEDSDLALRVRHACGKNVWLQPLSRLIHYEGKTSGTDTTKGVKAFQVTNAVKLKARWRLALAQHRPSGQAPMLEKDRGVTKRALVLDATTPEPDRDAGSLTCFRLIEALQRAGYKTTFAAETNLLFMPDATGALQRLGVECLYAPYVRSLETYLKENGDMFDVVLLFRKDVAGRMTPIIRRHCPRARIIFHTTDLHYLREQRRAELEKDAEAAASAERMRREELGLIKSADATVVHSTLERDVLAGEAPGAKVFVFPWILDAAARIAPFHARRDVGFLGGYRHPPNVDAVLYFVNEVWPLVLSERRDIRFKVLGADVPDEIFALHGRDNVDVVGYVPDLAPVFDTLRLAVAPIRYGAGIKGKVAMSLAHGVPSVVTTCAAEGMGLADYGCVEIHDDPRAFAQAIVRLYDDEGRWNAMSEQARRFVDESYGSALAASRMQALLSLAGA